MPESKPAALFDFDKTLLCGESLSLFLRFVTGRFGRTLLELPRLGFWMLPYALGAASKEKMKTRAFRILRHVPEEERPALVAEFLEKALKPRLYPAGREVVSDHRRQGHTLVLASASCDVYMEPVRQMLKFDVLVSTRTQPVGPECAPVVVGDNCYGEEKVRRLSELDFFEKTDWAASCAYSDHPSDLPMMMLCGNPVAANPNRALRKIARREGWKIADWAAP
jgi:HAD superfamily hydrolase (TIGR01490 family)